MGGASAALPWLVHVSATFDPRHHPDTVITAAPMQVADRPTARLAAALVADLDQVCDGVVATIRERLDGYDAADVPRDDLWWSVRATLDAVMRTIAEDRTLRPDEIAARSAVGTRRARQQLALGHLAQAYQIAQTEAWRLLTEAAREEGQQAIDDLVEVAGRFWAMLQLVSTKIAEAHTEASRAEGAEVRLQALDLLDHLTGLPERADAAAQGARALGLDPDGPVVAAVRPPSLRDDPLRYLAAGVVLAERPGTVVLLTGAADDRTAFADEPGPLGVGLARTGLEGAVASLRDAEQAAAAARTLGRDVVRFRDDWFACVALEHLGRLDPLVADAVELLRADDRAAETVAAYLAHQGRLGPTGQAVHVHANTVKYRLDRFAARTGLDPRDPARGVDVALALLLAERRHP